MVIQYIEADVPARSSHRDEATVDVVPERETGAAVSKRLELPSNVLTAPVELEHPRRFGALHMRLGNHRRRRSDCRKLCGADAAEVLVGIERSPFTEMLRI